MAKIKLLPTLSKKVFFLHLKAERSGADLKRLSELP